VTCSFAKAFIKIFWAPGVAGFRQEGGVGSKVPSEMISSIQSLSYRSCDWAILMFHQSHAYYYNHHLIVVVSCHRSCFPGTSLETTVIPTTQASSFRLLYFVFYVWCSKYKLSCVVNLLNVSWYGFQIFPWNLLLIFRWLQLLLV